MAHNMERKMFASKVKNPWWSKEGENYVYENATNQEILQYSRANFPVKLVCLSEFKEQYKDFFILENEETGMPLRQCKGRYTPIQTNDFAEKVFQLGNVAEIGAIGEGEKVFFSLDAEEYNIGEGNTHKSWINCVLPHDGTMKITFGIGTFRIECANTFNAWKRSLKDTDFFSVKQTAKADVKIDAFIKAFNDVKEENKTLREKFSELAKRKYSPDSQATIIQKIFKEKESTRSKNIQAKLAQIIGDNASKIPVAQRGTGYDIFNGITYFTTHESILKKGTERNESLMFGSAQKLANEAFDIIMNATPDDYIENKEFSRVISI